MNFDQGSLGNPVVQVDHIPVSHPNTTAGGVGADGIRLIGSVNSVSAAPVSIHLNPDPSFPEGIFRQSSGDPLPTRFDEFHHYFKSALGSQALGPACGHGIAFDGPSRLMKGESVCRFIHLDPGPGGGGSICSGNSCTQKQGGRQ